MPISKGKKKEIIEKVSDLLKDSKSVVFFNFKAFNVKSTIEMRRKLRESKVGYMVAKKTLAKRAFDEAKIEGVMPVIVGETAMAYSADLTAPAREVFSFQKKYKDNLSIVGGIFDGKYMNKEEMMAIALIPSQQTLYAQFVNVINSPIQGFVMALDAIAKKKTV
jgi:large subunit ribosomal protein L10